MTGAHVDEERLLDLVYRTTIEPSLWPEALELVSDAVGGAQTWLSELNVESAAGGGWIARLDPAMLQAYSDYYYSVNITAKVDDPRSFLKTWKPCVLTLEDWIERETLERSEYYNDFMAPHGIYTGLYIRLAKVGSQMATLNVGRFKRHGQFETDQLATAARLQPHLIRAYHLGRETAALRHERDDLAEALDRCAAGAVVLGRDGEILFANRAAERLIRSGDALTASDRILTARRREPGRALQALIQLACSQKGARGGGLAIDRPEGPGPLYLTVTPARSDRARSLDSAAAAIVWIVDPSGREPPDAQALRALFGFSPAEARVAIRMLGGEPPDEAAEALGLSVFTVRAHVRRMMEKTGVRRQTDLMTLLARLEPIQAA